MESADAVFICCGYVGSYTDKCYRMAATMSDWEEMKPLGGARGFLSAAAIHGRLLFSGGDDDNGDPSKDAFLLDGAGENIAVPDLLQVARSHHCSAAIGDSSIAVIGGWVGKTSYQRSNTVERFRCTPSDQPTCQKVGDGPSLLQPRSGFACGVLQTGGPVS